QQYLLILAGAYNHETHRVSRPTIVYDKGFEGVYDAHDNPAITLDANGYIWIFVAGRNVRRDGTILRSTQPYSIESFETIRVWPGMTYPQPWFDGNTFHFFFTKYTRPRNLYFSSSSDGVNWSEDKELARFGGHYQVSGIHPQTGRIGTFFNYHPESNVDRRTNVYYIESGDGGENWTTIEGAPLALPLTEVQNPALAVEYESRGILQYTSDLNWDAHGNPLLMYVASTSYMPGPVSMPDPVSMPGSVSMHDPVLTPGPSSPARAWHLTRWTGSEWATSVITETTHSYDMGSLHVDGNRWLAYLPSGEGPQLWGTGGEVEIWVSEDRGETWKLKKQVTRHSEFNHMYVRRPVNAQDPFFVFWADGDTERESESRFYFSNRDGTKVWRLPYTMQDDWEAPEQMVIP
ncbi:MAG: BNR repeat-containing protein, partial [Balneolales bacterium]|nr:BNR repeat-containing protein [Balneolales bacterium]